MARLERTYYQLNQAQKKLEKYSKSSKQFQVQFSRQANSKGNYHTKIRIIRGEKQNQYYGKGLLHKTANLRFRIVGDKPSITKHLQSFQPTMLKGHIIKKTAQAVNFTAHHAANLAVTSALGAETFGIQSGKETVQAIRQKNVQKYRQEATDDYNKGVIRLGATTIDAVRGTYSHFKQKKQFKLEKAKYKLKKAEYKIFKEEQLKPKLAKSKSEIRANKKKVSSIKRDFTAFDKQKKVVTDEDKFNRNVRKIRKKKRTAKLKKEIGKSKNQIKQLKNEKKFQWKVKQKQWRIADLSRPAPLALKPASYTGRHMAASQWQKAINEDETNDFLKVADEVKRHGTDKAVQQMNPHKLKEKNQKKKAKLEEKQGKKRQKLKRQESRLKSKDSGSTKRKKRKIGSDSKPNRLAEFLKKLKNMYAKDARNFMLVILMPIIIILLILTFIIMIFTSIFAGGGFTLGTYAAQDYDLSEAEKYYTKLAYDMNEQILKVSDTDKWKKGLVYFGAKKKNLKDDPDTWYWGRSDVYDWDPVYDFDCYKLWSFLCAYYYDFDADDNGDIKYWKFGKDTKTLLDEIFEAEYEFVYYYDNTSHWEELSEYTYDGQYYRVTGSGTTNSDSYGYVDFVNVPSSLNGFANSNRIYFNLTNGEILNYSDEYSATGYYFQDQRYIVSSPSGTQINPFYQYNTDAYQYSSSKGFGCYYNVNNTDVWMPKSYYSFTMSNGKDFSDNFCVEVAPSDVAVWKYYSNATGYIGYLSVAEGKDLYYDSWDRDSWITMCREWGENNDSYTGYGFSSFYQKYEWVEDCRLYYNVKQKKTFDEVIEDKLKSMSHKTERWEYYQLLVGNEDGNEMYGNHQTIQNMLSGNSIRDYTLKQEFGYEITGWNQSSSGLYQGIKVYATSGSALYAPFDCTITDVDTTNRKITISKDDVVYWYDGSGGTKRDTEITIANAKLISGLAKGDTLKEGEKFAKTTAGNVNFHIYIDTDGYGWDYIDPRLVLY